MSDSQVSGTQQKENIILNISILLVLLLALSSVLVYFNVVSCGFYSDIGCDVFYGITAGGKPRVLIVYGSDGMGDPQKLAEVLKSPRLNARVTLQKIDTVSLRLLQDNQLVIVEKAKTMGSQDLIMFRDYVSRGGRLVWIGDSGTKAPANESDLNNFLLYSERKAGGKNSYIGPWARKNGDKQLSFDYLLGVDYIANYCEIAECSADEIVGYMDFPNQSERLSNGLTQGLEYYGDFSIVKTNSESYQKGIAFLDYKAKLTFDPKEEYFWLGKEKQDMGKSLPMIISSGVGGRVAYYSFAPEYVVGEKMPVDKDTGEHIAYWGIIENMYYGMLYK